MEKFKKAFEAYIKANGFDSVEADPQMEQLLIKGKVALWAYNQGLLRAKEMCQKKELGDQYKDCPAAWLTAAYKEFGKAIQKEIEANGK